MTDFEHQVLTNMIATYDARPTNEPSEATKRMAKTLGTEWVSEPKWQKASEPSEGVVERAEQRLRECSSWLLRTDLDMQCPMETDPLNIADELTALTTRPASEPSEPLYSAADLVAIAGEADGLREALDGRDKFIVDQGMWPEFVEQLPGPSHTVVRRQALAGQQGSKPMDRAALLALAERCEAAEGPDRELDVAILTHPTFGYRDVHGDGLLFDRGNDGYWFVDDCETSQLPAPTASLDAALTLYVHVPERVPSNPRLATAEALRQRAEEPKP